MKWMIRKRLESDWMDERDREAKAGEFHLSPSPCVYLPFLKGTSVDEREIIDNILDRVRILVSKNESEPVVNVSSLGRSIHYININ